MKEIVSIVGRPNVGKSTLFNRILGYRKAITEDVPGVTRDRNYGEFDHAGRSFILVDTGGFDPDEPGRITSMVKEHIYAAVEESSMIIFLMDCKEGLLPQDREMAAILRRHEKPVFYAVNKVDPPKREMDMSDFYALGVEKLYPLSAAHGLGVSDLLDDMATLAQSEIEARPEKGLRVAIVGRPNTGKSSIVNRLLGSERMIVSDIPGTTRDAIDSALRYHERRFVVVDTAGIRRKSRIAARVEEYSVVSALRSIERADVVNLILDAHEGVAHQDSSIAHLVMERGKGLALVVNKWDLVDATVREEEYAEMVRRRLPHADFAPILFVSAKTGRNVVKVLEADLRIERELKRRIGTGKLNKAFEHFTGRLSLPHAGRRQVKIFYVSQAEKPPPTFVVVTNYPDAIPEHYRRYLENAVRESFGFEGAPIRLVFRKR